MCNPILRTLFAFFLIACFGPNIFAQDQATAPTNLNEAFEELKAKSANYEQYQVVSNTRLNTFWEQVTDSLKAKESTFQNAQNEISQLHIKMQEMTAEMAQKDKKVTDSQYLVDHLKVLGISLSKNGYVYFNFFVILVLALVIGVGFGRFKENEKMAAEKNKLAESAEAELEEYKRNAKEKEMKLRRELQTEINKNEDLSKEVIQLKKRKTT